jgi:membrane protein
MGKIFKLDKIKENLELFYKVIKNATVDTIKQDGIEHSGYIAFLSLLSLFPATIFFVAAAGFIGESQLGTKAVQAFLSNVPHDIGETIKPIIDEVISGPSSGILSVAFIGIIWTASSAIEGVRTILNRAYRVDAPPMYIFRRLLSILHFFIFVIMIMMTVFVFVVIPVGWAQLNKFVGINHDININILYFRQIVMFCVLFFIVSLIYYIIPNAKLKFSLVTPGAFLTVIGWIIAGSAFTWYLRNFNQLNIVYGSLGGIVVSLLFFYVASMIFVWGAEFNYHFNKLIIKKKIVSIE